MIAALFKTWKQPKCPLTDEWLKQIQYIHNGILLSHKTDEMMPFAAKWMDPEIIILNEVRQKQIYDITYMWNLKNRHAFFM